MCGYIEHIEPDYKNKDQECYVYEFLPGPKSRREAFTPKHLIPISERTANFPALQTPGR
jgi:hypothetical protein